MAGAQRRASNGVEEVAGIGNWPPEISSVSLKLWSIHRLSSFTRRNDGLGGLVIFTTPVRNEVERWILIY